MKKNFTDEKFLGIKVNAYILKEVYRLMKNQKCKEFIIEDDDKIRKRAKYESVACLLGITATKMDRIVTKNCKSMFTKEELARITSIFGISKEYFDIESSKVIPIAGVTPEDWRVYFNVFRNTHFEYTVRHEDDELNLINNVVEMRINKCMSRAIADCFAEDMTRDSDVIYRIVFYYRYKKTYNNEITLNRLNNVINDLDRVTGKEWEMLFDDNRLDEAIDIMEKQLEYVKALKIVKNHEK